MTASRIRKPVATVPAYLALSLGLAATPAMAQNTGDEASARNLGGMTVTDTAIDEGSYKTDKADSPKYTAPLVDTPRSITVVSFQLIQDTASNSLVDALRTVPGITFGAGEGGNPQGDRPFIRGTDSQASTYLDGVRDIGAQSRDVFAVEQIEVVKGSDGTMGGRGSAGGSINLVSKAPTADRFITASGSIGNADYKRATIDINQPINDFVGVRLAAMYHDQDVAGRDAIWSRRWGVAPSVKLGLNGPTSLTIGYYHLESNELPDSGIPYQYALSSTASGTVDTVPAGVTETTAADVKRGAYYGLADRDFRKTNVNNFTIRAQHDFGNGLILRNTTRYGESTQGYVVTQPDDSKGNVANGYVWRRANTRWSKTTGLINQTDLTGEFTVGGVKNSFALSGEISEERADVGKYVSNAATGADIATGSTYDGTFANGGGRCGTASQATYNCTSLTDPNPYDPWVSYTADGSGVTTDIVRSAPKTWTLSRTTTKAASVFDTISITDSLLINLGGRYDHYETRVSPGLSATSTASRSWYERTDDLFTYQAGLVFKPASNGSVYASTSTSATPPGSFLGNGSESNGLVTTSQSATDALKVEKTKSYEIGTKWNLFNESLSLTLAAFRTETQNARSTDANNTVSFIGEKLIKGIEFGYAGNITPEWSIFGGYTYMDSKIVDGGYSTTYISGKAYYVPSASTGKRFPNTPEHSFTAFTNYKVTPAFTVGGGAIYMGKVYGGYSATYTLDANNAPVVSKTLARYVPSYWRFDASASYKFNDAVQLQVNVQNMFNKRYFDKAYSSHYANQAAGRTAIATLNVKL